MILPVDHQHICFTVCEHDKIFFEINFDMAAKRHKKHKNKISGLLISRGYKE